MGISTHMVNINLQHTGQAHSQQRFLLYVCARMSKPRQRPLAGLTVEDGYAVSSAAKPVATADPAEYASTLKVRREREQNMRKSQVFQSDDPWAQAVANASKDAGGYLRPLSQRDREALVAEAAVPITPEERMQWAEQKERKLSVFARCRTLNRWNGPYEQSLLPLVLMGSCGSLAAVLCSSAHTTSTHDSPTAQVRSANTAQSALRLASLLHPSP